MEEITVKYSEWEKTREKVTIHENNMNGREFENNEWREWNQENARNGETL